MKSKHTYLIFNILLCVVFMVNEANVLAGTTGKITGRIIDAETGNPLPGANIIIESTTYGAAADVDGFYMILNLPPGSYILKASMMGYTDRKIEGVRSRIDLTTTINFSLHATVLETGLSETVVAERPLVQKDMTYSLSSVSSDEIASLPVQSVTDVIGLQAGVVQSDGLHIRGGRSGEIAYWVDGVSTTDVFSGGMGIKVENSAIEELQVVSGTFNAEYGQAMSGIINIITKEGGSDYHGELKTYVGDYVTGSSLYDVWKSVEYDPTTGKLIEERENPLRKFNPIYNGEFSLSGPVPFMKNKLSFFANGRYYSKEGHLYGRDWFKPQGIPGDSSLVALNPFEQYSAQFKLTFKPNPGLKLGYNIFNNRYRQRREFNRYFKYNPDGIRSSQGGGLAQVFTLNHVLAPSTFYEVRINRFNNDWKSFLYDNPEARPHWKVMVLGDSLYSDVDLDLDSDTDKGLFEEYKQMGRQYRYYVDPNDYEGYVHPDSSNNPASYSFARAGNDLYRESRSSDYWVGKVDFTSQINKSHQVKFGSEIRLHELKLDSYTLQPKVKEDLNEQIVPFAPVIPDISTIYHDKYTRNPKEFSGYLQDKLEYNDINLNIGLRFDYFDPNYVVPTDPRDPNIYNPFWVRNRYSNYPEEEYYVKDKTGKLVPRIYITAEDEKYTKTTLEERKRLMHKKAKANWEFSPRLAIAYSITDRGVIHFSYGHFFQIPEFQYLYDNPDFKLISGDVGIMGNAELNPQRTTQYEVGLQQQLTDNLGIDITLFYRDIRDWVEAGPSRNTYLAARYSLYENKAYSNVRGVTLKVEKRFAQNISYRIDYSFQIAEGTFSNPNDAFYAIQAEEEPRLNLIPLDWDQNHTLNGQLLFRTNGWTASLIGKYWTGRPYTPSFAKGARVGGTAYTGLVENSARGPAVSNADFYLMKEFKMAGIEFSVFGYIYNLFDQRKQIAVFSDTGTADYTTFPRAADVPYDPNRVGTVGDLYARPEWHIEPRQVQLGLTIGF